MPFLHWVPQVFHVDWITLGGWAVLLLACGYAIITQSLGPFRGRMLLGGAHVAFTLAVLVKAWFSLHEAQACMVWLSVYTVDIPSSWIYAAVHSAVPSISICSGLHVPMFFFMGLGTVQYFLIGWLVDVLLRRHERKRNAAAESLVVGHSATDRTSD